LKEKAVYCEKTLLRGGKEDVIVLRSGGKSHRRCEYKGFSSMSGRGKVSTKRAWRGAEDRREGGVGPSKKIGGFEEGGGGGFQRGCGLGEGRKIILGWV